mmetsp:Transcript_56717/g.133547  ORF Transcript_56717/g.133547 Transcript_56717/m.133547 type:complete len:364 (+) Transcript_56717:638-1729(+)
MVARARGRVAFEGNRRSCAGEALGGGAAVAEVVRHLASSFGVMPHQEQRVRQEQHQVALVVGALEAHAAGLELEGQVVAERAVEPQVRVRVGAEARDQLPHQGEDGGLLGALLLRELAVGFGHGDLKRVVRGRGDGLDDGLGLHPRADGCEEDFTAGVEGLDLAHEASRDELDRRVDEADFPEGVAAWVLESAHHEQTFLLVQLVHQLLHLSRAVDNRLGAHHCHASGRRERRGSTRRHARSKRLGNAVCDFDVGVEDFLGRARVDGLARNHSRGLEVRSLASDEERGRSVGHDVVRHRRMRPLELPLLPASNDLSEHASTLASRPSLDQRQVVRRQPEVRRRNLLLGDLAVLEQPHVGRGRR